MYEYSCSGEFLLLQAEYTRMDGFGWLGRMRIHASSNFFFYSLNTRGIDEVYVIHAGEFLGFDGVFLVLKDKFMTHARRF